MFGYIYLTTCLINNKKYIGQHTSKEFDKSYLGSGKTFIKALNKYGKENFKCELLKECYDRDDLNESEKYFIMKYDAVDSNEYYNISSGGEGHCCEPWNKGKHGVQPQTQKMYDALDRGRHLPASEKLKQKLSEYRKNVVVTDETKEKLRQLQLGKKAVNNGKITKYIKQEEIQSYLDDGWKLGRVK